MRTYIFVESQMDYPLKLDHILYHEKRNFTLYPADLRTECLPQNRRTQRTTIALRRGGCEDQSPGAYVEFAEGSIQLHVSGCFRESSDIQPALTSW